MSDSPKETRSKSPSRPVTPVTPAPVSITPEHDSHDYFLRFHNLPGGAGNLTPRGAGPATMNAAERHRKGMYDATSPFMATLQVPKWAGEPIEERLNKTLDHIQNPAGTKPGGEMKEIFEGASHVSVWANDNQFRKVEANSGDRGQEALHIGSLRAVPAVLTIANPMKKSVDQPVVGRSAEQLSPVPEHTPSLRSSF